MCICVYSLNNLAATYTNSEQYELAIQSYEASVKDRTEYDRYIIILMNVNYDLLIYILYDTYYTI